VSFWVSRRSEGVTLRREASPLNDGPLLGYEILRLRAQNDALLMAQHLGRHSFHIATFSMTRWTAHITRRGSSSSNL
jgi:hypothetical protein